MVLGWDMGLTSRGFVVQICMEIFPLTDWNLHAYRTVKNANPPPSWFRAHIKLEVPSADHHPHALMITLKNLAFGCHHLRCCTPAYVGRGQKSEPTSYLEVLHKQQHMFKACKNCKERYWYSDMSYWEETYFWILNKRIKVPVQWSGADCERRVEIHVYLIIKCLYLNMPLLLKLAWYF